MSRLIRNGIIAAVLCAALAAVILMCGCNGGGSLVAENVSREQVNIQEAAKLSLPEPEKENETAKSAENPLYREKGQGIQEKAVERTGGDTTETDTDGTVYAEPQQDIKEKTVETKGDNLFCTLTIRCDSVFENMDKLNPQKTEIIPRDGVMFPQSTVVFYEGESVFNVLLRELKKNKIHIDFVNTPAYNTAYIRGIGNLYERDCGETSGWMYLVNGSVPGYGCSQYILKPGDKVEWVYTCSPGDNLS